MPALVARRVVLRSSCRQIRPGLTLRQYSRAYDADLRHFRVWRGHLPSDAEEVARYRAHHAEVLRSVALRRRRAALAIVHRDFGFTDPTKHTLVLRVIQGIEPRHSHASKQVTPLLIKTSRVSSTAYEICEVAQLLPSRENSRQREIRAARGGHRLGEESAVDADNRHIRRKPCLRQAPISLLTDPIA